MAELTVAQALRHDLEHFEHLEDFQQEAVAEYFECPNFKDCELDTAEEATMYGKQKICSACKVRWLLSKWEG